MGNFGGWGLSAFSLLLASPSIIQSIEGKWPPHSSHPLLPALFTSSPSKPSTPTTTLLSLSIPSKTTTILYSSYPLNASNCPNPDPSPPNLTTTTTTTLQMSLTASSQPSATSTPSSTASSTEIVRNPNFSRYVRFNTMQAIVLDVLLIFPDLLERSFSPKEGVGLDVVMSLDSTIFLYLLVCLIYGSTSCLLGQLPRLPIVAEAAERQVL
ncbi:hypothetical protein MRB53_028581 [Persea americana]|uniref:Uncharacterized protein n=1 Tax=Persea americana TaxID=3435 RepID=A0ACC2KFY7_PERAE|nr:hypothetical protein MRB53_028581 [Persea americana]